MFCKRKDYFICDEKCSVSSCRIIFMDNKFSDDLLLPEHGKRPPDMEM